MTKSEITDKAILYLDDSSELSTQEFSDLFDKCYRIVNSDRPWEGTKTAFTGTTTANVAFVTLPTNFLYLTANQNSEDQSDYASGPVVFRGTSFTPYPVVSWSDRRQYTNQNRAYVDFANSKLFFTVTPTVAEAVEYDYHSQKTALTSTQTPWFPAEYHDAIYHLMVADDFIIQQSDKAKSYRQENLKAAKDIMESMQYWNSQLCMI